MIILLFDGMLPNSKLFVVSKLEAQSFCITYRTSRAINKWKFLV